MITTVIFDLDDTVYDEIEYCKSGFEAAADFAANLHETPDAKQIFSAFWQQFTAGNRTTVFNKALDKLKINYDKKLIDELVKVYRNHFPKINLPRDCRDILCQLKEKYTLALLTDGFLPAQQLKVQALGIEKYFKSIVYTEQLGRQFWKPSPVGFEKLLKSLNAEPEAAAYVADNEEKDFIAPNQLGLSSIQIIRPGRLHTESSEKPQAKAQYVIYKISQLPQLLQKL